MNLSDALEKTRVQEFEKFKREENYKLLRKMFAAKQNPIEVDEYLKIIFWVGFKAGAEGVMRWIEKEEANG